RSRERLRGPLPGGRDDPRGRARGDAAVAARGPVPGPERRSWRCGAGGCRHHARRGPRRPVSEPTASPVLPAAGPGALPEPTHDGRERSQWEELSRLVPYARRHRLLLGLTLLVSLFLAVIDVPVPFMLKKIMDAVLRRHAHLALFGHDVGPEQFLVGIFATLG